MTERDRVKASLTFAKPDRVPRDLWAWPFVILFRRQELDTLTAEFPLDIGSVGSRYGWSEQAITECAKAGTYVDDWGSVWHVSEPGLLGEVKVPLLARWEAFDRFEPPWRLIRERDLSKINRECGQSSKFMLSGVSARPFERLQFLRGTEELFVDIANGTREFSGLLKIVHEFYLEDIRSWCKSDVDGILFMDDWGANDRLLINPAVWREIFKPLYKDYCDEIHAGGKFAFFHSDGNIEAIFRDLIEVGIDSINSQLSCMQIDELARLYKSKVTFWGELDQLHLLPFANTHQIRQAVGRLRSAFDDGSGGVIAQCVWGKDAPMNNIRAVFDAWNR
ncbi:MAG: hypothetical protein M1570_10955 [Chloroflexi bacterium]|nr:hypothetical protein [Chloroflexota bacterium]